MNRILDFHPEEESEVVHRIVMHVHRAIDENFPHVKNTSQKFSQTQFSVAEKTHAEGAPKVPEFALSDAAELTSPQKPVPKKPRLETPPRAVKPASSQHFGQFVDEDTKLHSGKGLSFFKLLFFVMVASAVSALIAALLLLD